MSENNESSVNVKEENLSKSKMIRDINDTFDTNDTTFVSKVSKESRIIALGVGKKEKILNYLFDIPEAKSYTDIANAIADSAEYVKVVINRNADLFIEDSKQGNTKLFKLSPKGYNFVKDQVELYEKKKLYDTKSQAERERELRKEKELKEALANISKELKPIQLGNSLYIDFETISLIDPLISDILIENPDKLLYLLSLEFESIYGRRKIRISNLPKSLNISVEKLRAENLNKLISLDVRVTSISDVRPTIQSAKFECPNCGAILSIVQTDRKFREPTRCTCGWKTSFKLLEKDLLNTANLTIEDLQEKVESPNLKRLKAVIQDDLTSSENIQIFAPGKEVRVCGILKEVPIYIAGVPTINLGFIFEINSVITLEPESNIESFEEKDIEKIKQMAKDFDEKGFEALANSFAPAVHGYEEIKSGIMCQLACRKNEFKKKSIRNKMNLLLIGDPGIAKSELAKFAHSITPGTKKAVGGTTSAVGITASVVKEEEELGGYRLEPGAMVLAQELLILEELNNLNDEDKPKIQEALSEQSVSINKANIHVKLNVTCGTLGIGNPKNGVFNKSYPAISQFNIPIPILNRFDLIFLMMDEANHERDIKIADKMIQRERQKINQIYTDKDFEKYFVYVRSLHEPEIDDAIALRLRELYADLRKGKSEDKALVNPRFFESLIRLVKSSTKMRLSEKVENKDVDRSLKILSESFYKIENEQPSTAPMISYSMKGGPQINGS